jgi:hypothetical protein
VAFGGIEIGTVNTSYTENEHFIADVESWAGPEDSMTLAHISRPIHVYLGNSAIMRSLTTPIGNDAERPECTIKCKDTAGCVALTDTLSL